MFAPYVRRKAIWLAIISALALSAWACAAGTLSIATAVGHVVPAEIHVYDPAPTPTTAATNVARPAAQISDRAIGSARASSGASRFSLAAEETTSVFWSGGQGARDAAEGWASANGGTTLEMTARGAALEAATSGMPWEEAQPLWEAASKDFAANASGEAHVFLNPGAMRAGNIWEGIERKALLDNPNVTGIVEHLVGGG